MRNILFFATTLLFVVMSVSIGYGQAMHNQLPLSADDDLVTPDISDPGPEQPPNQKVEAPSDTHPKCLEPKNASECAGWCGTKTGCKQCCNRIGLGSDALQKCYKNCNDTFGFYWPT